MPSYIVKLKDSATDEDIAQVKKEATEQGGTIGHEYTLIKAFSVSYPAAMVGTLESHPHVEHVEEDGAVTTQ